MEKAYRYRIYPNKQQQELIQKTFGCARFVYNYYLAKRKEMYENDKITFTYNMCSKDLTNLKKELEWLKEPDKDSLQKALKDLDMAYQKFFKNTLVIQNSNQKRTGINLIEQVVRIIIFVLKTNILNFQNLD